MKEGRIFILEGPDECGKTTLALALAKKLNGVYFHCTASKAMFPALMDYHMNIMENIHTMTEMGLDVVLDRFWPSEVVYGLEMFRPDSGYNPSRLRELLHEHKTRYIFCLSDNGWSRYEKGHVDPAHSLTREQYEWVMFTYKIISGEMLANENCLTYYSIEFDGFNKENFENYLHIQSLWNP